MKLSRAIDVWIEDMRADSRIRSENDACRRLRAGDAAGALLAVEDADALAAGLQEPTEMEAA